MAKNKYKVSPSSERKWWGHTFGSKAEMRYCQHLEELFKAGVIRDYILQPRKRLGVPENIYVPDFHIVPTPPEDGEGAMPYYVDVKGFETQTFKKNKRLWLAYGRATLVIVKETSPHKFKVIEEIVPCWSENS